MGKKIVRGLIVFYQNFISPWLPSKCRFYPTCSQYTLEAVNKYGVKHGLLLGIKSIPLIQGDMIL